MNLNSIHVPCSFKTTSFSNKSAIFNLSHSLSKQFLPESVTNLLLPIIHHYQLLMSFILLTMWLTNNQSKINFIRARLSDDEALRSIINSSSSIKGFFIGLLMLATAIIVLLLKEDYLTVITHTAIQVSGTEKSLAPKLHLFTFFSGSIWSDGNVWSVVSRQKRKPL